MIKQSFSEQTRIFSCINNKSKVTTTKTKTATGTRTMYLMYDERKWGQNSTPVGSSNKTENISPLSNMNMYKAGVYFFVIKTMYHITMKHVVVANSTLFISFPCCVQSQRIQYSTYTNHHFKGRHISYNSMNLEHPTK